MNFCIRFLFVLVSTNAVSQHIETVIQKGHELAVLSVAVSPDSNYLATGSKDKSVKLWELNSRREVRSFFGHEASVTAIAFSPDGKYLYSGGNDKAVKIWEIRSGKELYSFKSDNYITTIAADSKGKFLTYGGYNNTGRGDSVTVLDLKSKREIRKISVNPDKGLGTGVNISLSPDGEWVAIGEDDRKVNLYRSSDWKKVKEFGFEDGFCGGCAGYATFSSDNRHMFIASRNGNLKKIALDNFTETLLVPQLSELTSFKLSADNKLLVVVSEEQISVFSSSDGSVLSTFKAEEKAKFNGATFSRNSELVIGSDNNTAVVLDPVTSVKRIPFAGMLADQDPGGLNYDPNFYWQSHIAKYVRLKNNLLLSRDGKSLIKGKFGTRVKQWDIASGRTIMEFGAHKKAVLCFDQSRDGKVLLTGGGDGKVMLWDIATGDSLLSFHAHREPIFDIHFSADEMRILSTSWDGTMKIYDRNTGSLLTNFSLENAAGFVSVFHPSGLYVFSGRLDNSLEMWEPDTRTVVRKFIGHTGVVSNLQISSDHRRLLSSSWDGSVRIWDVHTGLMTAKLVHHTTPVHVAIFDPSEKFIYSAGADRRIKIWDVNSGELKTTLEGHNAEITALIFGSDNKTLISHSLDGVTKFWNLQTDQEFFEHVHLGERDWLVKNREGYFTGTDGARKYIHFVDGIKTYAVDQFFHDFYRPDLMPRIFGSRGANELKGIYGKLKNSPPPDVKIAVLPAENGRGELLVRMTDTGSGVIGLNVLHNGKSLTIPKGDLEFPATGKTVTFKMMVDLVAGNNTFTAIARNKENVESDPRSVEIVADSGGRKAKCYVLAVGINEYRNSRLNLNYAKPDAVSFSKMIEDASSPLFEQVIIQTIYDSEATKEKILQKLDELGMELGPEDVFVFYYAGHGSMVDNRFYFIPTDNIRLYDAGGLKKEAIDVHVMQEKLKKIRALKQLIIMDACQSGGSVELLAVRGANEEKAIAQLSRSTGIHVLASAGSEQFASEFGELGHGLFTYVLIKALSGEADGAPRDGKVTIYELKSYIDDQVPELTKKLKGKPQYPYTFSRGHDFPVVIRK